MLPPSFPSTTPAATIMTHHLDATIGLTVTNVTDANSCDDLETPSTILNFQECIPLDVRLEIYAMVDTKIETRVCKYCSYSTLIEINELVAENMLQRQIFTAAVMNDIEVLQVLFTGLPIQSQNDRFELDYITEPESIPESVSTILARCGYLTTLKWLCKEQNMEQNRDAMVGIGKCAAYGGHRHILQWIQRQRSLRDLAYSWICTNAAHGGHFQLLKWLRDQRCTWDEDTCVVAAARGHLGILRYLHEHGCPWNSDTCHGAARGGHLEIIRYLHEQGCEWTWKTCMFAAMNGHLEMLRFLHERGCPWDQYTCSWAARCGHLEVLRYAHEQGCPWDSSTIKSAIEYGYVDIALWAFEHGCLESEQGGEGEDEV